MQTTIIMIVALPDEKTGIFSQSGSFCATIENEAVPSISHARKIALEDGIHPEIGISHVVFEINQFAED